MIYARRTSSGCKDLKLVPHVRPNGMGITSWEKGRSLRQRVILVAEEEVELPGGRLKTRLQEKTRGLGMKIEHGILLIQMGKDGLQAPQIPLHCASGYGQR